MISRRYFLKAASGFTGSTLMPTGFVQSIISEQANASPTRRRPSRLQHQNRRQSGRDCSE